MANQAGKNFRFEDLIAKGENTGGTTVQAPSGTYYPTADDVAGGDGRECHWMPPSDGRRWGHNPMPVHNDDPFCIIPSALPISRKLRK